LNTATLDQHFDEVLRNVRAEFERTGEIRPGTRRYGIAFVVGG